MRWRIDFPLLVLALAGLFTIPAAGLDWEAGPNFRSSALPVSEPGKTGFTRLRAPATGLAFTNFLAESRWITNRNILSGSGVAAGDVDGDGWCDLYFCGLSGDNALFRNLGNWKFEDITARAGVACPNLDGVGAAFADLDGDGDLDLIVTTLGAGTRIFRNDGRGAFAEVTVESGVASKSGATSVALGDVDGDGDLDLYVAHYRPTTIMDRPTTRFRFQMVEGVPRVALVDGQPATLPEYTNRFVLTPSGKVLELSEPDVLYLNDGQGRFTPRSFTEGAFLDEDGQPLTEPPRDWSLAVQMHDLNGDGAPDIYLCSDLFTPDRIWINDGKGHFRALARLALRNTSTFSMGVDFADIDRDGRVDFFVTDMFSRDHVKRHIQVAEKSPLRNPVGMIDNRPQYGRNTLQLNRGDGTFAEIGFYAGVEASEWSWGPIFLDVDLDGYEDLLVPNGQWGDFQNADIARQVEELRASQRLSPQNLMNLMKLYPRLETENLLFRNRGDTTFEEVGTKWGFNAAGVSQGVCLADLDNDGDLEVVMNNLNAEAGVFRNDGHAPRVAVRLKGLPPNTRGIGARIKLLGGAVPMQSQEMISGGRYLSGDDPMRVFAAGVSRQEMTLEVTWRNGRQSVVNGVKANRVYEIREAEAKDASERQRAGTAETEVGIAGFAAKPGASTLQPFNPATSQTPPATPWFEDVSHLLGHSHVDEPFEDFVRQPLLPAKLSQLGPGVSWFDVDGNGTEDLLIGSGKGGSLRLFLSDGRAGFTLRDKGVWTQTVTRDLTTILGLGLAQVLAGSANYEDGLTLGGAVKLYTMDARAIEDAVSGEESSSGPMAAADAEGDGDLDLFVGGRVVPGRYPEPATSVLYRNEAGNIRAWQRFEKLGLVSGAVFSDLNGDGRPELILACEWGPVRIFRNESGTFQPWNPRLAWPMDNPLNSQLSTLNALTGWWNGVTTGDLDGDGRLDIIASNWGLNSKYQASAGHPRKIYHGDLDGNGTVDVIEAYWDAAMNKEVPERSLRAISPALPLVQEKWTSFQAYGQAGVAEIFGDKLKAMAVLEARTLASMAFLNRGDHFEAILLPKEAQFAPAFGVNVGDADGDGNEDVFLSQNFFAMNSDTARCDAGRGLWLRGDGGGKLRAVPGSESGVMIYGEQRGSALGDYDGDGRLDLVVAQNGNETKLYHNRAARPGLRARLKGPAANPSAVGAKLRLLAGEKQGPVREVRAGSGYWSQDSAVQVLNMAGTPTRIWVQWPGGKVTLVDVPTGAKEITISPESSATATR